MQSRKGPLISRSNRMWSLARFHNISLYQPSLITNGFSKVLDPNLFKANHWFSNLGTPMEPSCALGLKPKIIKLPILKYSIVYKSNLKWSSIRMWPKQLFKAVDKECPSSLREGEVHWNNSGQGTSKHLRPLNIIVTDCTPHQR